MIMQTICVILVSAFTVVSSLKLPPFLTPCPQSVPTAQLSECILTQAKIAQPYFAKGIPEYNVDPIDPLTLPNINAAAGTFTIKSTNVVLKGLKDVEIKNMRINLQKNLGQFSIFGNFSFSSDYQTEGSVLLIPITGKGKLSVKMYDTEIQMKFKIRKVNDADGLEYLQTYDMKFGQTYGNCKLRLTNLLGGAEIGDTVNQVLNENWRDIMAEVGGPFIKAVIDRVHEIVNQFYSKVPFADLTAP